MQKLPQATASAAVDRMAGIDKGPSDQTTIWGSEKGFGVKAQNGMISENASAAALPLLGSSQMPERSITVARNGPCSKAAPPWRYTISRRL